MLEKILSLFNSNHVHRLALITSIGSNIIKTFEQEFANDHGAKDAAIDTLVDLLKLHKANASPAATPVEAPAAAPVPPAA